MQHVIFDYIFSNNNKNVFVENVKKLIQNIAVSGEIRYDAPKVAYKVRTLTALLFEIPENPEKDYKCRYVKLELRGYFAKAKEAEQNKKTWTKKNQVVYNLFLSHCTPEMGTKLQGMETWGTIDPKKGGLGMIALIRNFTYIRDETVHAMLDVA